MLPTDPMGGRIIRFFAVFLMALTAGFAVARVVELPSRLALTPPVYLNIQRLVDRDWGRFGSIVETAAFIFIAMTLARTRGRRARALTATALACVGAMILIWIFSLSSIEGQVSLWTFFSMPEGWAKLRTRWELWHAIRSVLAVIGLSALIIALLDIPEP